MLTEEDRRCNKEAACIAAMVAICQGLLYWLMVLPSMEAFGAVFVSVIVLLSLSYPLLLTTITLPTREKKPELKAPSSRLKSALIFALGLGLGALINGNL